MKKYLLILGVGAMILQSSCDSMENEAVDPQVQSGELSIANARMAEVEMLATNKIDKNYQLAEYAYEGLEICIPKDKALMKLENTRDEVQFIEDMIRKSMSVWDSTLKKRGQFLSPLSQRNHDEMAGDEHEIEFDIASFIEDETAAIDYYLRIPDIPGESRDGREPGFHFSRIIGNSSTANATEPCDNIWCDSIPPVKKPETEETAALLLELSYQRDPAQTSRLIEQLKVGTGMEPVQVSLLLPAVQRVREAARLGVNARGKADILIETLGTYYGVDVETQMNKLLAYGGAGSLAELVSEEYDDEGDIDWATIQLNRKKFEMEMLFFWKAFWETYHGTPTWE